LGCTLRAGSRRNSHIPDNVGAVMIGAIHHSKT